MALAKFMLPLKDEVVNDPLGRGYSNMTDQEVVDDLNTAYREKYRYVPMSEIHNWASAKRLYKSFVDAGLENGPLHNELKVLIQGKQESVDFQSSATGVQGLIQDLIDNGIITDSEAQDLQGLSVYYTTRARELGYPNLTERMVHQVREEI